MVRLTTFGVIHEQSKKSGMGLISKFSIRKSKSKFIQWDSKRLVGERERERGEQNPNGVDRRGTASEDVRSKYKRENIETV